MLYYYVFDYNAVDFIIKTCHEQSQKIYLCPVGPLTNIAKAIMKDPTIINKVSLIILSIFEVLLIASIIYTILLFLPKSSFL